VVAPLCLRPVRKDSFLTFDLNIRHLIGILLCFVYYSFLTLFSPPQNAENAVVIPGNYSESINPGFCSTYIDSVDIFSLDSSFMLNTLSLFSAISMLTQVG